MTLYYETELGELYHGDCLEIMPELEPVDLVLTDPPYGINIKSHGQNFIGMTEIVGDGSHILYTWLDSLNLPLCAFYSPYRPPDIKWRSILVWSKGGHVGGGGDIATCWKRDFELIGVKNNLPLNGKRDISVLNYNAISPPPSGHVAEKPVALMVYLVKKIPATLVVDPFIGSGTTAIACERLKRKWIGIEIEEKYCEIAAKRIEQERKQLKLF